MMAPRVVIFDVGNVLYGWDPHSFLEEQIPEDQARLRFLEETDFFAWHEKLDAGDSFAEAADRLSALFPAYAHWIQAWGERFGETIKDPVPGVHEIVRELHAQSTPLFAITNFSAECWAPFHAREERFFAMFKDIVVSGEVKMLKPDPAIYQLAVRQFGISAGDAIFIDDRAVNVAGAEAVGMKGHLFTDAPGLRSRLEVEGLL
jgi:2-haloacid dehalogenase